MGDELAFSQDQELWTMSLEAIFPDFIGEHTPNEPFNISGKKTHHHGAKITDITYSADGDYIVSCDYSGKLLIWDTESKELKHTLHAHDDIITSLSVSSDNQFLATGSSDETVKLWTFEKLIRGEVEEDYQFEKKSNIKVSRRKRGPFPHEIENIISISFSPDNKYLASGDLNGVLVIRDINTKREVYRKKIHNHAIQDIAFSPTNTALLATASDDSRIRIIDLRSGGTPKTMGYKDDKHTHGLNSVAFSHLGDVLVSSGTDSQIKLWDVESGELIANHDRQGEDLIDKVRFFPNKYDFTTNSFQKEISLWHVNIENDIS